MRAGRAYSGRCCARDPVSGGRAAGDARRTAARAAALGCQRAAARRRAAAAAALSCESDVAARRWFFISKDNMIMAGRVHYRSAPLIHRSYRCRRNASAFMQATVRMTRGEEFHTRKRTTRYSTVPLGEDRKTRFNRINTPIPCRAKPKPPIAPWYEDPSLLSAGQFGEQAWTTASPKWFFAKNASFSFAPLRCRSKKLSTASRHGQQSWGPLSFDRAQESESAAWAVGWGSEALSSHGV